MNWGGCRQIDVVNIVNDLSARLCWALGHSHRVEERCRPFGVH